jgi:toxin ParE1/3/4
VETRGVVIVRFTRRAEDDLAELVSYLAARSPEGARNVAASLLESFRVIGNHPFGGRKTDSPAVLVAIVPRYPYKIFYRLPHDGIDILHIRHASRRPWIG